MEDSHPSTALEMTPDEQEAQESLLLTPNQQAHHHVYVDSLPVRQVSIPCFVASVNSTDPRNVFSNMCAELHSIQHHHVLTSYSKDWESHIEKHSTSVS